jgi:hypothetical protein
LLKHGAGPGAYGKTALERIFADGQLKAVLLLTS